MSNFGLPSSSPPTQLFPFGATAQPTEQGVRQYEGLFEVEYAKIKNVPANASLAAHNHNDLYYSKAEDDALLASKANTTGNVATSTALQTARTINGVSFNGTANITVAAAAGTLTGATLAPTVVDSSLTRVGILNAPTFARATVNPVAAQPQTLLVNAAANGSGEGVVITANTRTVTEGATFALRVTSRTNVNALTVSVGGAVDVANLSSSGAATLPVIYEHTASVAISAGVLTLDTAVAQTFNVTRNANITSMAFTNPTATVNRVQSITLVLTSNGNFSTVWPASVLWADGTAPTLSATSGKRDVIVLFTVNGGTTWLGSKAGGVY